MNSPTIRPQAGPMKRFQNTGTLSSGGLVQSRSELRGTKRTLPPSANIFSASFQELVIKRSVSPDVGHSCRPEELIGLLAFVSVNTQKFHSFSKYVTPRTTPGPGAI